MRYLAGLSLFLLAGWIFTQCQVEQKPQSNNPREAIGIPIGSSDMIIDRLALHLVANPEDPLEHEVNTLINAAIDHGWDLHFYPPGILYSIHTKGTGRSLQWGDYVSVHYQGWALDGQVFDSSFERDEPFQFYVGNVVPGWNEVLQHLLVEGSRGVFLIPSELAYGAEGFGSRVAPHTNLVFDMEVISLIKKSTE